MDESGANRGRVERLAQEILGFLREEPRFFIDVLKHFREHEYRLLLLAWSRLREERRLERDRVGRYVVAEKDR